MVLASEKVPSTQNRFIFRQIKARSAREQPPIMIELQWGEEGNSLEFENLGSAEEVLDRDEECAKRILVWIERENKGEFRTAQAVEAMKLEGFSKPTIERALRLLGEQGKLVRRRKGVYLNPYVSNPQNHPEGIDGSMESKDNASIKPIDTYIPDGTDGKSKAEE